jgi:hypothetical protein
MKRRQHNPIRVIYGILSVAFASVRWTVAMGWITSAGDRNLYGLAGQLRFLEHSRTDCRPEVRQVPVEKGRSLEKTGPGRHISCLRIGSLGVRRWLGNLSPSANSSLE